MFNDKRYHVLDGATGTMLSKRGLTGRVCPEKWILENRGVMLQLQKEYIEAGSDIIFAPSFGANRAKLSGYGLADKVRSMNLELAALSLEAAAAASHRVLVGGDLSPTGLFMEPFGEATYEQIYDIYAEQARALAEAGVDFFIIETCISRAEAEAACAAVRRESSLPVMVSMTCDINGRTLMGDDCTAVPRGENGFLPEVYGLNCSSGPDAMAKVISRFDNPDGLPLLAKPNAGMPKVVNGQTVYDLPPAQFAAHIEEMKDSGVLFFGGCCGTEPAHIRALKEGLEKVFGY